MLRIDPATVTPTLPRPLAPPRVAAAGTLATALLLCLPGTGLAAGRPDGGEPPARSISGDEEVRSSSGLLARGAGYAVDGGAARVRQLQRALRDGAYAPGPIDGLYGPLTEAAVRRLQQSHGLVTDGLVGAQTLAALRTASLAQRRAPPVLRPGVGYRSPGGSERVLEVQRMLSGLGVDSGPLDGLFGPQTQAAVQWFQVKGGVRPTGIVDQVTLKRLRTLSRGSPGIDGLAAPSELELPPLPAAGWRGRPISNPHRHPSRAAGRRGGRSGSLRPGAGYRSETGSERVRRLQRSLRRLGYRPGAVDGLFGPRTKAAVQWFQMKHGLSPRGAVDSATLRHLRGLPVASKRPTSPTLPSLAARPPRATPQPSAGTPSGANAGAGGVSPVLLVLVAAFGAAALSLLTVARGRRRRDQRVPPPDSTPRAAPLPTNGHAGAGANGSPAPAPPTAAQQRSECVVGYASAQDRAELERQAATIERACHDRGWTLACVIRENGSANGNGRKRPGLAHAVKQVREGPAGRLVVDSLAHLGRSEGEIRAQLERFAGHDIELVSLDTDLHARRKRRRRKRAAT